MTSQLFPLLAQFRAVIQLLILPFGRRPHYPQGHDCTGITWIISKTIGIREYITAGFMCRTQMMSQPGISGRISIMC